MKNSVSIMLDKERNLKFGVRAYIAIEKATGKAISKVDFESTESIFVMIYGALVHEDKKLTVDKVIDIVEALVEGKMDKDGIGYQDALQEVMTPISEKVMEAMGAKDGLDAMPKE